MNEEEMLALLAGSDLRLRTTWAEILAWLRENNALVDIQRALETGDYARAIRGIEQAGQRFAQAVINEFTASALAAASAASTMSGGLVTYDSTNNAIRRVLELRRLEITSEFTGQLRELIDSVVREGLIRGDNPRVTARRLRDSIGLTAQQERIVENYRSALLRGDVTNVRTRVLHDGRSRLSRGMTVAQVEMMTEQYRRAWIAYRAETIARTEAHRVLHEGVDALFDQAYASGELDPAEIEITWASALRPTTRDHHRSMHGQKRRPGEAFMSGNGVSLRYPGDATAPASERANCLCTLQRRMKPRREVAFG
jgi:hypothetical protein